MNFSSDRDYFNADGKHKKYGGLRKWSLQKVFLILVS